jgi:hypothetical protein
MTRSLAVLALVGASTLLAACSVNSSRHQIRFEVNGDGGAAAQIRYELPNGDSRHAWRSARHAPVPWSQLDATDPGVVTLEATPTTGALTCRIILDGTEITRVTGEPGQAVACRDDVAANAGTAR